MDQEKNTTPQGAFRWERMFSRLIAAWSTFAAMVALRGDGFEKLSFAQEIDFLPIGLWTLAFFALYSIVALLVRGIHTDSWMLMAAATVCVFRWLLGYEGTQDLLFLLAVSLIYCLFAVYFMRANLPLFERIQPKRSAVALFATLAILVCFGMIAVITCLRYKTFSSPNFDFGLFCNMFYNMRESGEPLVSSERDRLLSHFAVHVSPAYYLFLPFYWLFPYPETLQICQAAVLAAGVIPVILLAKHFKLSAKSSMLVAALYAFHPAISAGCFYDLHENCFLPLFLLCTFLFYEKKKYVPMYLSALLVLSVKEDAAIYLMLFAAYLLLSERRYGHGIALAVLSSGYFGLCAYFLEKHGLGMMVNRFDNLIYDKEEGLLGAVKTALANPGYLLTQLFTTPRGGWEKFGYALQMLLPLGLLPFCSKKPSRWLLAAPILINLLTNYVYQYDIGFQYHFGITAFLIYATAKNLPELTPPTRRHLLTVAAAVCCCMYVMTVVPKANVYINRWQENRAAYQRMDEVLDTIPKDASVSCSTFLLPHIADRDEIYETQYHQNKTDIDYVAIDLRYEGERSTMQFYLDAGYSVYAEMDGLLVILKK